MTLRDLIAATGTQRRVAAMLGVQPSQITRWLRLGAHVLIEGDQYVVLTPARRGTICKK